MKKKGEAINYICFFTRYMEEPFVITVVHNGHTIDLDAQLVRMGYTYKFKVIVQGEEVFFEPDEEGSFRAVLPYNASEKAGKLIEAGLLQTIADKIKEILT